MKTYRTIQGDTWDSIAFSVAGKESFMVQLMNANPDYAEVVIFPAGVLLQVPVIPVESASTLPPWRQEDGS
ncbi:phage Tail Protein X [Paenibacillus algicola]|uniref:Phage Tail Protein X n=1 Tax=Paenibacillus algicola TaxID=2565926 RepID=A0A4P8XQ34_9BACL|nr:tail protein X [Paenibacillus algicola]QCT03811.1 phage Tail Protein X [Paenibacillus algicola]